MKDFSKFSKEDQKLICEALLSHNNAVISSMKGNYINNSEEFTNYIRNMSADAKEFMIETLKNSLPEEYRV